MPADRPRRGEAGFTIVEALAAAFLLILGIGSLVTVIASSGHASSTAERNQGGLTLAQREIEKIRGLSYDAVGLNAAPPAPGGASDPLTRVSGTTYTSPGSSPEALVMPSDCPAASPCAVAPFSTVQAGTASQPITAKIYRFVSWRPEGCGLLPRVNLATLNSLGSNATAVNSAISTLITGTGTTTRSLGGLIASITASNSNLTGVLGVIGNLLPSLTTTVNAIVGYGNDLKPVANSVLGTLGAGGGISSNLSALGGIGSVDLCKIDLSAVKNVTSVKSTLDDLQATLTAIRNPSTGAGLLADVQDAFNTAAGAHCVPLPIVGCAGSALTTLQNALNPVSSVLAAKEPSLKAKLNQVAADVSSLNATIPTLIAGLGGASSKQTKRVSVAIVLDPAGPAGPKAPIWMTTVVTDPDAGLLSG